MKKIILIAGLALGLSFAANALSMSESTTIGNTVTTSHGKVQGVERTLSVEDTQNAANFGPFGSTSTTSHDEKFTKSKYKGNTHGSSNTSFTSVNSKGPSGVSINQTNYSGDSLSVSNIKYTDKYTASGYADNEYTGVFGTATEHTEYESNGKSVTQVHSRTEADTSGWSSTWGE